MNISALDMTGAQWNFLAALEVFGRPVSVDLIAVLAPLSPGRLLELIEQGETHGFLIKDAPDRFTLADSIPKAFQKKLDTINTPARLSRMIRRLDDKKLIAEMPTRALIGLYSRAGRTHEAALLEFDLGREAASSGQLEQAYRSIMACLDMLAPVLGNSESDKTYLAAALDFSSLSFILGLNFDQAVNHLEHAREAALRLGDQRSRAMADLHLGRFYYMGDQRIKAIRSYEIARKTVDELGDEDILIQAAEFIGLYYFLRGLHKEAIDYFERATQASEATGIIGIVNPSAPLYLGFCAVYLGQFQRAIGNLDSFWHRAKREGNSVLASTYRAALGTVLLQIEKKKEGRHHLEGAVRDADAGGNILAKYSALGGLAYYYFTENQIEKSRNYLARLIEEGRESDIRKQYGSPYVLELLYEFHRLGLKPIPDFTFHDEVARLLKEPSVHLRGVALRLRAAESLICGDDLYSVRLDLDKSEQYLLKSGDPIQLAKTRVALAQLCLAKGDQQGARTLAQKARKGLSGHSENLFPNALRTLLRDIDSTVNTPDNKAEALAASLNPIFSAAFSHVFEDSLMDMFFQLNRLLGAERGGLFWKEKSRKLEINLKIGSDLSRVELKKPEFKKRLKLLHQTFLKGCPWVRRVPKNESRTSHNNLAILLLPLTLNGTVQAVLYYDNSFFPDCFDGIPISNLHEISTQLSSWVQRAYNFSKLFEEIQRLSLEQSAREMYSNRNEIIFGPSPAMIRAIEMADRAANTDSNILVQGETGVGKELLALRIHKRSHRSKHPLITVDPTTIPENLMESELFGHEKGAFTGADRRKPGWVELADKGTLFIDEIGEIPKHSQAKLLRVLQEKSFVRIGGTKTLTSQFRLIAATNRNLEAEVSEGRFRQDLYYRLNIVNLTLPPLRERSGDIRLLAQHFLDRFAKKYNRPDLGFTGDDHKLLKSYPWPGNVRELKNVIERAVILSSGSRLQFNLPNSITPMTDHPFADLPTLDRIQRRYIRYVLKKTGSRVGGVGGAAEVLGLKRTTLNTRMKKLGLKRV